MTLDVDAAVAAGFHRVAIRQGFLLILLALAGGVLAPFMVNYRMGIGAHTLGILGGIVLILLGLVRPLLAHDPRLWPVIHICWFTAAYCNWANTMLAGLTGASFLTPVAGGATTGAPWAEAIAFVVFVVVGVTSALGTLVAVYALRPIGSAQG